MLFQKQRNCNKTIIISILILIRLPLHWAHIKNESTDYNKYILLDVLLCSIADYYMALSHKDWELPNSRVWLAEMDIDRGLDFPI